MTFLLLLSLSVSPVEAAKAHLQKGQLDDVVFDLDGQKLKASEQVEAVKVLAQTAKAANDAKDYVLALHLAQMALKLDGKCVLALEAGARAAFAQQMFEDAEKHADAWLALEPKSAPARLLRAELAAEAGEWDRALEHLQAVKNDTPAARELEARVSAEKSQKSAAMSQLTALRRQIEKAAASRSAVAQARPEEQRPSRTADVVVYGTSWCGYCAKAREWLTRKGVSFIDRDVEQDEDAARELANKCAAAGVQPSGVPVIDVHGKLILGFDPKQIEQAL